METVMMPRAVPAAIPMHSGFRPASPAAAFRVTPMTRPGVPQWRPAHAMGQAQPPMSVSKGADVLFSLLTAVGAMTVGIAAMTVGIGSGEGPARTVSPTWRWIGGITAALGTLMIIGNVAKISKATEMVPASTTATAQPRT